MAPPGFTLPLPEYCVNQMFPLESAAMPHMSPIYGTTYSWKVLFEG
jgi:hypothetical protein